MASNKHVVPAAKEAMEKFKMETANEVGVTLKQGYNGDLTSKQAGSIGGQMVNIVTPARTLKFNRKNRIAPSHQTTVTYTYRLAL